MPDYYPVPGCRVCNHPDRAEIERQIATNEFTIRGISEMCGISPSVLHTHYFHHVAPQIRTNLEELGKDSREVKALDSVTQLVDQYQVVQNILFWALEQPNIEGKRLALKALKESRKFIELNAKITGQYSDAPQVNIMMSPVFLRVQEAMIESLESYPEARIALSAALENLANEIEDSK